MQFSNMRIAVNTKIKLVPVVAIAAFGFFDLEIFI